MNIKQAGEIFPKMLLKFPSLESEIISLESSVHPMMTNDEDVELLT